MSRVLLIITKSNFGGAQRYVYEIAKRLKEEQQEVAVALGGDGELKQKLKAIDVQIFPITSAQRDISLTKEARVLWSLYKIVRKYKPTVVHLNSPKIGGLGAVASRVAGVLNSLFSKSPRLKILYTNHGWPFNEPRPEWQQILIKFFSWLTVFLGGKTIVLSQTERNDVEKWPFVQKKFEIIPNGVSEFPIKNQDVALGALIGTDRATSWTAENRLILGTISELHRNKGLFYAIDGIGSYAEQYPEQKLAYVVIGEGEQRKELEAKINEMKSKKIAANLEIVLAGHVADAREYLKAFDIFLLSSVKEGLPFAILEAGHVGVPVISTSVGGIPEVIQNLENGLLIPPRRPQEIRNALIYLHDHQDIKEKMIETFKNKIKSSYNFDTILEELKKLYKN